MKAGESQTPMLDKQWFVSGLQTVLWDSLRGHMKTGLSYLEINSQKSNPQKIRELLVSTFPVRMWAEPGTLTSPQYSEMNSFFCTDSLMKVPHPATSEGASSRCWGRGRQALDGRVGMSGWECYMCTCGKNYQLSGEPENRDSLNHSAQGAGGGGWSRQEPKW